MTLFVVGEGAANSGVIPRLQQTQSLYPVALALFFKKNISSPKKTAATTEI